MVERISPRTACRYLRDVADTGSQFHTSDGAVLKNLIDLSCYLGRCEDEAFRYHVGPRHNHFSNWVGNVILDRDLADQMSLVLSRNPMKLIVAKRVNELVHHATRSLMPREKAGMILEDVVIPEEHFIGNDGRVVRNLWELEGFLRSSKDHTIAYHVSPARNDIEEWVRDVLMDPELADALSGVGDREEMARHVKKRVSQLEAFRAHKPKMPSLENHIRSIRGH